MGKGRYESIICVDLRSFDRNAEDLGVNAYFKQLGFVPTGLCFLNFQVMYLFDFENVDDRELDPICTGQNGTPCGQVWTNRDLYRLITYIRSCGVKAYLGILSNTISAVWKNTRYHWEHREVLQTMRGESLLWGEAVNVLKRLKDGRFFEDVYIEKLMKVLDAFHFDGYVAGDGMLGLRGPRETLKDTDFSQDMVDQFTEYAKLRPIVLEDYNARADYIVTYLMPEWIDFWCARWVMHVSKVSKELKSRGMAFLAIDAWSRNPEEIREAFGIDYHLLYESGLEGVFVQARETNKWRKHREGEYVREQNSIYTFLAHKAYEPRLKYYWAQATVNVPEFWNTIQDLPHVAERECYGYLWTHCFNGTAWEQICEGVCIIWGNDLSSDNWNWLRLRWDQAYQLCRTYHRPIGIRLLWSERGVKDRVHSHIADGQRIASVIEEGVCIQASVHEKNLRSLMETGASGYFITTDETLTAKYPEYAHQIILICDGYMKWNNQRYGWGEGISILKQLAGIQITKGRLCGFETEQESYVVSLETPDNLFYEQGYLAIDREIVQVKALPPREWFVLPHSVEEGSVAVSIPPDASIQLVIETNRQKKMKLRFRKKDLGI